MCALCLTTDHLFKWCFASCALQTWLEMKEQANEAKIINM